MAKATLSNQLIGKKIRPAQRLLEEQELLDRLWGLKPNQSHEYFAIVQAAWLSEGQHVKVLASGPMGDMREIYIHDGLIELGDPIVYFKKVGQ